MHSFSGEGRAMSGAENVSMESWVNIIRQTYPLRVKIRWLSFSIEKVSVDARLVYSVQLSLVAVKIRLPQRPCLREVHLIQCVSDFEQLVVLVLEPFVDLAVSVLEVSVEH